MKKLMSLHIELMTRLQNKAKSEAKRFPASNSKKYKEIQKNSYMIDKSSSIN